MSRHHPELAGHVASARSWQTLVAVLLLTALALALAACAPGGAPAAPAAPTSAPAAQPTAVPPTAAPAPTATSAPKPTDKPTAAATEAPKAAPTEKPAATATQAPTQAPTAAAAQRAAVSFAKDVKPILDQKCVKCHGGEKTNASLSFKSYADLMKGSENGPVVVAGKADESEMIKLVTSGEMPKRNPRLPAAEVKILQDWVNGGAQNN